MNFFKPDLSLVYFPVSTLKFCASCLNSSIIPPFPAITSFASLYPANILDKMTVTFIIPQSRTGMIEDIVVCYMGYHDFIKFLDNNKIIINNKRMKTTFSNAIDKDKLSFMYKSIISDDRDYSFDMDSYDKNNYACNRIIEEIKENHFSNNYF